MNHLVRRAPASLRISADWNYPAWQELPSLSIDQFHPDSSDHRPQTRAKLAYTPDALLAIFHVRDRYVKSVSAQFQEMVCNDSCVELFAQPKHDCGYFNFELNCGGTMLLYYIEDATRVGAAFAKYTKVSREHAAMIEVVSTMPKQVPVEIESPVDWSLALRIPFAMMEPYVGAIGEIGGQIWRGNLFKCGDQSSHPHWASWAPIGEELNFHQPKRFGRLEFDW
jgi:hypothetical protein